MSLQKTAFVRNIVGNDVHFKLPEPSEPSVSRKMGDVETEVVRIQNIIDNAHDQLSGLTSKLTPILSQPLPTSNDSCNQASEGPSCPMVETLRKMVYHANELVSRLSEVSERVRL